MAFIDTLEAAGEISEVSLIKFLHHYKFNSKTLHFFFEGLDDQSFYVNFIESIFSDKFTFHYYVCDGKANVYNNYNDINWSIYNKNQVMFFTDKDLDDLLNIAYAKDENIFETKYYSIENYLVTSEVYGRFLREICYINEPTLVSHLKAEFDKQLGIFSKMMINISAWVIYCRRNNLSVNLSDIDISKIFHMDSNFKVVRSNLTTKVKTFDYICTTTKTKYFNLNEIKQINKDINQIHPPKIFLRGKYELWFLFAFCNNTIRVTVPELNKSIKKINKSTSTKVTKAKVTISLKFENLLQVTAPRVRMPNELFDFLTFNKNKMQTA